MASKDNKIKELKEKMIEDFKADEPDFKIKTKDVREPKEQHGPGAHFGSGMSQGEIEYSGAMKGHRAYYIICPEEMESTEAVVSIHQCDKQAIIFFELGSHAHVQPRLCCRVETQASKFDGEISSTLQLK